MFIWLIVIVDVGIDYEYCYQIAKTGQHTKHALVIKGLNNRLSNRMYIKAEKTRLEFISKFINNQLMYVY